MPNPDNLNAYPPIFIVGMPRSGTTLMTAMLSAHPHIAIPSETHFLRHWIKQYSHLDLTNPTHFADFWQEFTHSQHFSRLDINPQTTYRLILNTGKTDFPTIFTSILQEYATQRQKTRWGEKTPDHYQSLNLLFDWYPQAKIIWMVRDPRAVTASLLTMPWANSYVNRHAITWRDSIQQLKKWVEDQRVISINYENLINHTEAILKQVCEFINEDYTSMMIFGRSQTTSPLINYQGSAKINKSQALKQIDSTPIYKWQAQLSSTEIAIIEQITRCEMLAQNYHPLTNSLSIKGWLEWIKLIVLRQKERLIKNGSNFKAWLKKLAFVQTILQFIDPVISLQAKTINLCFGTRTAQSFNNWTDYFQKQPIAGYIGFVGYQNLGDEALYLGFKKLFTNQNILLYYSRAEPDYRQQYKSAPIELILYRNLIKRDNFYDFVFLGGGTLIHWQSYLDWFQEALHQGKPGIVLGTGVADPAFWQEKRPEVNYTQLMADWVSVLKDASYVAVRGFQSARILEAHGLTKPQVIGDPALSLCIPRQLNFSRQRIIGINLGSHGFIKGEQNHINEVIACVVHHLLLLGWQVEFLPLHKSDFQLGQTLIHQYHLPHVSIWQEFTNIEKTLARIQSYDLVLGQRLHSAVLACGCGVPTILLEYQPKCRDFMESIEQQKFCLPTDALELDHIYSLIDDIDHNYQEHSQQLVSIGNAYRFKQKQAAQHSMNLISLLT
ncbi:sulfotransferase [Anabaena sp. UHCC 0451]|uniref:sulfotransferase n=1 Tax=Anabaena sp. UHCC 0451 TaxID=2055235 RepID=UPI002B200C71|nr:sulfotransferase [Anabaena sp. UHCC 0451]MEA5577330.1 sulfotransferase [Anabaena sp. UHCC 0451]